MPIPTCDELMLPILKLAKEQPWTYRDLIKRISDDFRLTEIERKGKSLDGSVTLIDDHVHRSRTMLKERGLIEKSRDTYLRISPAGIKLLASNMEAVKDRPPHQSFASKSTVSEPNNGNGACSGISSGLFAGPDRKFEDQVKAAAQSLDERLRDLLLAKVLDNSPIFFERLIIDLMKKMRYGTLLSNVDEHLGSKADGGVDGVIHQDQLGLDRVYLQAKRYQPGSTIGPDIVREFIGALSLKGASKGVLVTTSSFSRQAQDEAKRSNDRKIILIDGVELAKLMVRFSVGVRVTDTVEIKHLDLDYFEEARSCELP